MIGFLYRQRPETLTSKGARIPYSRTDRKIMDLEEYLNEITDTRWAALDYLDSINEQQTDKRSYEATIKEVQTA